MDLLEKMNECDQNELIGVNIWLCGVDENAINKAVERGTGYPDEFFLNTDSFNSIIIGSLSEDIRSDESKLQSALSDIVDNYQKVRLAAVKAAHVAFNTQFIEDYKIDSDKVIHIGKYISEIKCYLTATQIKTLALDDRVDSMSLRESYTFSPSTCSSGTNNPSVYE
jgi:hypothetical protein